MPSTPQSTRKFHQHNKKKPQKNQTKKQKKQMNTLENIFIITQFFHALINMSEDNLEWNYIFQPKIVTSMN